MSRKSLRSVSKINLQINFFHLSWLMTIWEEHRVNLWEKIKFKFNIKLMSDTNVSSFINRRLTWSSFLLNGYARSCCIASYIVPEENAVPSQFLHRRLCVVGSGVMLLRSRKYIARAIAARRRELYCPGKCCRCESRLRTIAGRRSGRARVVWLMSQQFARSWIEIGRSRSTTLCINSILG